MKMRFLVAAGFVMVCTSVSAVDKTIDKSGHSYDPMVCEEYIKINLELCGQIRPDDAKHIREINKSQGSCAAQIEMQKILGVYLP